MGNFKQHLLWATAFLSFIYAIALAMCMGEQYYTFLYMTLMFVFGGILPDVDLHHERWYTMLFMTIAIPLIGYLVAKKASHWGRIHSIGFGLILSMFVGIELLLLVPIDVSFLLAGSLFCGFLFHLICDQIYHEARMKKDHRVALKLWSNGWSYDPLVWIFKRL